MIKPGYEIKVSLPNGFTILLDFADTSDELDKKMNEWMEHYKHISSEAIIKAIPEDRKNCSRGEYSYKAMELFGKDFGSLDLEQKGSVAELVLEDYLMGF